MNRIEINTKDTVTFDGDIEIERMVWEEGDIIMPSDSRITMRTLELSGRSTARRVKKKKNKFNFLAISFCCSHGFFFFGSETVGKICC